MTDDGPRNVADRIRYAPKAVTDDEWIESFLAERPTGVVGLVDDGRPYVVTQLFVYDPGEAAVFLHGANAGRTRRIVESAGEADASFTTSRHGRFVPAEKPVDFTVEYESVDAFGRISLVGDPAAKRGVLEAFMAKLAPHLAPGRDYEPIADASIDRTSVYRIDVAEWSAKRGLKDPDHPGAYDLDAVRERDRDLDAVRDRGRTGPD